MLHHDSAFSLSTSSSPYSQDFAPNKIFFLKEVEKFLEVAWNNYNGFYIVPHLQAIE